MEKENCIIIIESHGYFILELEDEKMKEEALEVIKNGGVFDYGYSEDIDEEEFEYYKEQGYTIVEL